MLLIKVAVGLQAIQLVAVSWHVKQLTSQTVHWGSFASLVS